MEDLKGNGEDWVLEDSEQPPAEGLKEHRGDAQTRSPIRLEVPAECTVEIQAKEPQGLCITSSYVKGPSWSQS